MTSGVESTVTSNWSLVACEFCHARARPVHRRRGRRPAGGGPGRPGRGRAGPWEDEDWLAGLRRESIPESLLADGAIASAAAAEHGHRQERALNAEVTALCLVTGALFPVLGYDSVLALVFGMPGVPVRPGTPVPTGPAYSKARERHGEAPARAMFEADAARDDIPAGPGRDRVRPGAHPDRRHDPGTVQ